MSVCHGLPCGLSKDFIERVRKERIVETRSYRYIYVGKRQGNKNREIIGRIPIRYVGGGKILEFEKWTLWINTHIPKNKEVNKVVSENNS